MRNAHLTLTESIRPLVEHPDNVVGRVEAKVYQRRGGVRELVGGIK